MTRAFDLSGMQHGLTTERQLHIHRLLQDYDPNLSLRRIPERDPAFRPPKVFGVYEEHVGPGQPNWVFTLAEYSIDERILARVRENDFRRLNADGQWDRLMALKAAQDESRRKAQAEVQLERDNEMRAIGRMAAEKSSFRHTINGEEFIVGDTLRRPRTHIS